MGYGDAPEAVVGVLCCVVGGFFNSCYPLFPTDTAPRLFRVQTPKGTWEYENTWLAFTSVYMLANVGWCFTTLGADTIHEVYAAATPTDLALVCAFSFLWGAGTLLYSMGVKLLGAGLGVSILMSLLIVIGTLLPLIRDYADDATSAAALLTLLGLVLAIFGFALLAKSSLLREDRDRWVLEAETHVGGSEMWGSGVWRSMKSWRSKRSVGSSSIDTGTAITPAVSYLCEEGPSEGAKAVSGMARARLGAPHRPIIQRSDLPRERTRREVLIGICVCSSGAVMASMAQFAFIFSDSMIEYAEDVEGVSQALSPNVVWLLAFSLSGIWNLLYAVYLLNKNSTWDRFSAGPVVSQLRRWAQMLLMSFFFVAHIYLYGVAQALFGNLGTVVSWPLLMSSTVLFAQAWGQILGEWKFAPRSSIRLNIASISVLLLAITIIAIAGAGL
jgi:hypothetical protein